MTLMVSSPALATARNLWLGESAERAGVAASENFVAGRRTCCSGQINHGDRAFAGNGTLVHADGSVTADGADQAVRRPERRPPQLLT